MSSTSERPCGAYGERNGRQPGVKNIFVFPYGGGSASSYRFYAHRFPAKVGAIFPVEIPGHGQRADDDFAVSIQDCAAQTLAQIDTREDYILHGHCMGALLAFETIKLLAARGDPLPRFMVASGRDAPRHGNAWLYRSAEMDDRALFDELQQIGGIAKGLSFAMAQPFLAVIRADQAMFRDYDPGEARVTVPILALAGRADAMTHADRLADWRDYTTRTVAIEWLDGRHYFILERPDQVARLIDDFAVGLERATPDA